MRILLVCGTRPNFVKVAALCEVLRADPWFEVALVHTGQHRDAALSAVFFDELGLPEPDVHLGVGPGGIGQQTGAIAAAFENVLLARRPDLVMVVGDVTSTVACALVAKQHGVQVAHVEAGLRSFDRTMPEEIHRLATDAISDLLFVSEESGLAHLRREGIPDERVFFVGNVMIDTLLRHRDRAAKSDILERLGLVEADYALLTVHRPSNVDTPAALTRLLDLVDEVQARLRVVAPLHPRTRHRLEALGLRDRADAMAHTQWLEPLAYLDFIRLTSAAKLVLTDSGGVQEEATILGVPCLTLRENTERPATVTAGGNTLVGTDPARLRAALAATLNGPPATLRTPALWDGQAAARIAQVLNRPGGRSGA